MRYTGIRLSRYTKINTNSPVSSAVAAAPLHGDGRRFNPVTGYHFLCMFIFCCGCGKPTRARLVNGKDIYPGRDDLCAIPFWLCDTCGNYVGCHHKSKNRTKPLGCIPTKEVRNARSHIHKLMDPLWENEHVSRRDIYSYLSDKMECEYHTADILSVEDARKVYRHLLNFIKEKQL